MMDSPSNVVTLRSTVTFSASPRTRHHEVSTVCRQIRMICACGHRFVNPLFAAAFSFAIRMAVRRFVRWSRRLA